MLRVTGKGRMVAATMAVAAAFGVYIAVVKLTGFMPRCYFRALTGWQCPGCGSQRALMALIDGDPVRAWSYNLLLPVGLAYAALLAGSARNGRLRRALTSPAGIYILAGVIILWTIVRNLFNI